ncbi:MAG TPA: hydantoinase/oxoprolinase family protein [Tepidisphaeraceae bacterium]|nr:hydantoinase/oxoprolinase family protein [Tepidisphaeraceae bacterium]
MRLGIDVGGTFTDVVAVEGDSLRVVKLPSTPPQFHRAVIESIRQATAGHPSQTASVVHGSTVATNALLQRTGEPVAFVTTEGFRDMLLIGRQNRPSLYALRVQRPRPITPQENWFTVRERVDARGRVVEPLTDAEIARVAGEVTGKGLRHAAVCLLFSFVNPDHERRLGEALARAGVTVSLSSDVLPEFREYERASTTAINAALRPTVQDYLRALRDELPAQVSSLSIMHSGGGTLSATEAADRAAQLVLSGPAGGVIGAAYVARRAGFSDVITYDMGGTSTDVATVIGGRPQWTTSTRVDGLPIGLPVFDIHTVGAGGGSVAYLDAGGALRVGPRSAGAVPGPACYGRGGTAPTVTDANLVLGRILPDAFLGGAMRLHPELAHRALEPLAAATGKTVVEASLGIVRVAESNMGHAVRAVTARRGHDPRTFSLVTFGGAGGLHACALADALEIPRVVAPPYCGVLSALGMVVAPPVVDVSQTVVHLGPHLDDARVAAECGKLNLLASERLANEHTAAVEVYADVRFLGQSHELKVRVERPQLASIEASFRGAYEALYGRCPEGRPIEVVTLRLRRVGHEPALDLPPVERLAEGSASVTTACDAQGQPRQTPVLRRGHLVGSHRPGPLLIIDPEATTYVPAHWSAAGREDGTVVLTPNA